MPTLNNLEWSEKENNIYLILNCIKDAEEISASEIAKKTRLSLATISRVLKYLLEKELVIKKGKEITGIGRRPELFGFNNYYGFIIIFIIHNEKIQGTLADLDGNFMASDIREITSDIKTQEILDILHSITENLLKKESIPKEKLLAGMIGIPGVVDEGRGIIHKIPNLPDWENKTIFELIESRLEIPVMVENDSNLSVMGEKISNHGHCRNLVLVKITNHAGIGAGLIINDNLHKGSTNSAGEVGHMLFNQSNLNEEFGELGCLESYSGIQSLYERVNKAIDLGRAPILFRLMEDEDKKNPTLGLIEQAIELGDSIVEEIMDDVIRIGATAIVNICTLLDPDIVLIGGAINPKNKEIYQRLKKYVERGLGYAPDIQFAEPEEITQVIGGMHILLNQVFEHLILQEVL